MRFLSLISVLIFLSAASSTAQIPDKAALQKNLDSIASSFKATIGVCVLDLQSDEKVLVNNQVDYPMMSVYKFPLVLAVLGHVDKKKLSLSEQVKIDSAMAAKFGWSALKRQNPGVKKMSVDSLIMYTIVYSDNLSCDVLFDRIGGPKVADEFVKRKGVQNINVLNYEAEFGKDISLIYKNTSTPLAMSLLLKNFYKGNVISESSRKYLLNYMINDSTSSARLRGMVPAEITIAHKTGTYASSDTTVFACNDVGIMMFPDGRKYAVSVFVKDSKEPFNETEKLIARLGYEIYLGLKKN